MCPTTPGQADHGRDPNPNEVLISEMAYKKWVQAGRPRDDFNRFWIEAEQQLAQKAIKGPSGESAHPVHE